MSMSMAWLLLRSNMSCFDCSRDIASCYRFIESPCWLYSWKRRNAEIRTKPNNIGLFLPAIDKRSFFSTVVTDGALRERPSAWVKPMKNVIISKLGESRCRILSNAYVHGSLPDEFVGVLRRIDDRWWQWILGENSFDNQRDFCFKFAYDVFKHIQCSFPNCSRW